MRPGSSALRALAATLAAATASSVAPVEVSAQQATALDRFDPASASGPFFAVPAAAVQGELRPFGGVVFSLADAPLVLTRSGEPAVVVVDHQAILHVGAGLEIARRGVVEVSAPTVLSQDGAAADVAPATSVAFGDLRLGGRLVVLEPDGHRPAAAIALDVWLPTAADAMYAGAGVLRVAPRIVAGVDGDDYAWGVTFASRLQPSRGDDLPRSELEVGAAVGPRFGPLWVGPEVVAQVLLDDPPTATGDVAAEVRGAAKLALGPVQLGLAAGPGLGDAYGTPSFRILGSVGVAFEAGAPFAPPDGRANDGGAGAAPGSAAPAPGATVRPGATPPAGPDGSPCVVRGARCGPDTDHDGVVDVADACPAARGERHLDATRSGCPQAPDGDGDGIPDASDGCPQQAGRANEQPAAHGCPTTVRFDGSQLVIQQQVQFEKGSDALAASSDAVLAQVARALAEDEGIARLAVDGHTDGEGDAAKNLLLSQRRAIAVVRWLVDHGVDARRLEARGFGERRPLADDTTAEGRAKNRRVELVVRKRTPLGKEGWSDGPID